MKNYFKILPVVLFFLVANVQAQKKITTKKKTHNRISIKAVDRNFGSPASVSEITDVNDSNVVYPELKNLIDNYGVTISYADNTFRGKEPLKRGDFVVALNSALNNLRSKMDAAGITDTTLFNTYDRNRGGVYLTAVSQVKDIPENSIYYPAAKSLIERWGISAPFALNKTLSANSTISEKEVYDILRVTMGYNSAGVNPYATAISRAKFAIALNNAITQKMTEINSLRSILQAKRDAERKRQMDSLQKVDMIRKDSVAKEIQARKQEADRKEEEARKLLEKKKK
ncbi:MAG TPA: hypothetical protein VMY77_12945 [Chitinophagaceae bacterium]|nr:hypothetical protein [Chitinophagaceae bacterium]